MAPVVAPAPERASGLAAPGLLAWLLICKFADALPFYRQEAIFRERHRVFITRQQMVQWMKQGTALLEGIYRCIQAQLQASRYVQLDETPIDYLDPGKGRCSQGYLWTGHVPGACSAHSASHLASPAGMPTLPSAFNDSPDEQSDKAIAN